MEEVWWRYVAREWGHVGKMGGLWSAWSAG